MAVNKKKVMVDVTIDENTKSVFGNRMEREEEFKDMALGMFVHYGADCYLGTVISHWVIGADDAIVDKFYNEAPDMFEAVEFNSDKIARLARQAGMKYGVFTTKHHSGFCMYDTETTALNIMKTPFGRDMTEVMTKSFRKYGIKPGLYFSPLDFYWCKKNGKKIEFMTPDVLPKNNPGLMEYNKKQVKELMTKYGNIVCMFFDGPPEELRELVWKLQPDCLVTRGEMKTPEQNLPDEEIVGAWEACFTLGDGWSYKPTNETYKTGTELINMLIEIRARGGNLLLNVTPDFDGNIPPEQVRLLQELGTFLFFNGEAIYKVRPWSISHEGNIWFTKAKDSDTVYAFVCGEAWPYGVFGRKEFVIKCIGVSENTEIKMLGQNEEVLEHRPYEDTKTKWHMAEDGLHINAMRCYRPYDNRQWPNPVVFKITNAKYIDG